MNSMPKDYKFCLLKNEFGDVKGKLTFKDIYLMESSFLIQYSTEKQDQLPETSSQCPEHNF